MTKLTRNIITPGFGYTEYSRDEYIEWRGNEVQLTEVVPMTRTGIERANGHTIRINFDELVVILLDAKLVLENLESATSPFHYVLPGDIIRVPSRVDVTGVEADIDRLDRSSRDCRPRTRIRYDRRLDFRILGESDMLFYVAYGRGSGSR